MPSLRASSNVFSRMAMVSRENGTPAALDESIMSNASTHSGWANVNLVAMSPPMDWPPKYRRKN